MNFFEENVGYSVSKTGKHKCIIINGVKYHLPVVFKDSLSEEEKKRIDNVEGGYCNLPPRINGNIILVDEHYRYGIVDKDGNILVPFIYRELKPIEESDDYFIADLDKMHEHKPNSDTYVAYETIVSSDGIELFDSVRDDIDMIFDDGERIMMTNHRVYDSKENGRFVNQNRTILKENLPGYHKVAFIDKKIKELQELKEKTLEQIEKANLEVEEDNQMSQDNQGVK